MRGAFVGRKQVLDFLPLRVRQIAWVAFVLRTITFTLLFGPHEVTPCWRMENMGAPQSNRLLDWPTASFLTAWCGGPVPTTDGSMTPATRYRGASGVTRPDRSEGARRGGGGRRR